MVSQIGFIGSDIRANISKIEKFSLFTLDQQYLERIQSATQLSDTDMPRRSSSDLLETRTSQFRKSALKHRDSADTMLRKKKVQFNIEDMVRSCTDYFGKLNKIRTEKVIDMKKLFESIGPTLVKLESLILGTFTGQSPKMKQYYVFWEKEMLTLLIK